MEYKPTIGLEIHAQLFTKTKLFSRSLNNPEATAPNSVVSVIDVAHPGTLPTLNKKAIEQVIKVGLAVGGKIADYTEWDRKNYFYPDIPKAYQISQEKFPLVTGGEIAGFKITRIHLEEDTGRSQHDKGDYSLVDYNRAGVPLMELVTEPVIHSAADAVRFAKELQLILHYLGASEANLEKGQMRIEANISVSKTEKLGTKVEVKNINSFKAVEKAIEYEINRHIEALENGETIVQETRGWDENKEVTFSQRIKEDANDYRYFPDPDLPKLFVSQVFDLEQIAKELPELPHLRRARLLQAGLSDQQAEFLVQNDNFYKLYEETLAQAPESAVRITNLITSEIVGLTTSEASGELNNITAPELAAMVKLLNEDKISSRGAKDILAYLYEHGGQTLAVAEKLDLFQVSDEGAIDELVDQILADNPQAIAEFKSGKENALKFLIGQGMKLSKGKANPQMLEKSFRARL